MAKKGFGMLAKFLGWLSNLREDLEFSWDDLTWTEQGASMAVGAVIVWFSGTWLLDLLSLESSGFVALLVVFCAAVLALAAWYAATCLVVVAAIAVVRLIRWIFRIGD